MLKIRRSLFNIDTFVLLLIFVSSMNMFEKYFYFLFAAFISLILVLKKIKVDLTTAVLLALSILYIVFFPNARSSVTVLIKQFAYPISYIIGLNMFSSRELNDDVDCKKLFERRIFLSVIFVAMGSFLHFVLNMLTNIGSVNRNTIDVWSGRAMAATGQATLAILALAVFMTMMFGHFKLKWKIVSVFGCLLILAYNLVLSGRTLIFIFAFIFVEAYMFSSIRSSLQNKLSRIIIVFAGIVVVIAAFMNNWFGITELVVGSNLSTRFETMNFLDDTRFGYKLKYISLILTYPFGGGMIRRSVGNYAHDIILDTYSDVGIIGIFVLMIFLIGSIAQIIKFVRNKNFSTESRMLVLCVNSVIFIIFFFEPILSGMQWLFCSFCFFQGVLTKVNRETA